MDKTAISEKVTKAINKLLLNDKYLLKHDLNERSITHKLAEYLQHEFQEYNVDCEYNGNINKENNRGKELTLFEELQMEVDKIKRVYEKSATSVYPDIIIHERGTNDKNLLLIEVKKSTSPVKEDFDIRKIKAYTDKSKHNKLGYENGIFLKFKTRNNNPVLIEQVWFQNGEVVSNL